MLRNRNNYGQREEDAVNLLIYRYRKKLLKSSIERMSKNGLIWRKSLDNDELSRLRGFRLPSVIYRHIVSTAGTIPDDLFKLAETNYIKVIGVAICSFTHSEREFYNYVISLPFFCTHATSVRNVETSDKRLVNENTAKLRLESWKTLKAKGVGLRNKFLEKRNLSDAVFGNDDFVFLSLECGNRGGKSYSRFGNKLYRFPIEGKSSFNQSLITLNNLLTSKNQPNKTLEKLTISDDAKIKFVRGYKLSEVIAVGNIKKFICCSLILFIRQLPLLDKESLLTMRTEGDINILINSVFRPQICVPHRLYARLGDYEVIDLKQPQ